jgi:hypothetical protein
VSQNLMPKDSGGGVVIVSAGQIPVLYSFGN